jgi:hypothetical protein
METDSFSALFQVLGDAVQRLDTAAPDDAARARVHELGNDLILLHNELLRHAERLADLQTLGRPVEASLVAHSAQSWAQLEALAARITQQAGGGP